MQKMQKHGGYKMEEKNRVMDENELEQVQGGVNIAGTNSSDLVGNVASKRIGIVAPIHNDAKNSTGGNNDIFSKFTK